MSDTLSSGTLPFVKGHGTGNDFVLFADPDGTRSLEAAELAQIADRRFGIGGDGVIRAVRSSALEAGAASLAEDPSAEWFMDYHNADGSVAEMCGNGIRVYAEFLRSQGLIDLSPGDSIAIGTRGGVRHVRATADGYAVDLGAWSLSDDGTTVSARGLEVNRPGLGIDVGNPHIVVALASDEELDSLDLTASPVLDPVAVHGANVEFVVPAEPLVEGGVGRIRMRVHERGSGETLSCGTGAAAAALATRHWAGPHAPARWSVEVPGGTVGVRAFHVEGDDREHVELSGPAELVYSGVLSL